MLTNFGCNGVITSCVQSDVCRTSSATPTFAVVPENNLQSDMFNPYDGTAVWRSDLDCIDFPIIFFVLLRDGRVLARETTSCSVPSSSRPERERLFEGRTAPW